MREEKGLRRIKKAAALGNGCFMKLWGILWGDPLSAAGISGQRHYRQGLSQGAEDF